MTTRRKVSPTVFKLPEGDELLIHQLAATIALNLNVPADKRHMTTACCRYNEAIIRCLVR